VATAATIPASMVFGRSERAVRVDWGGLLVGQLEFYWDVHLRPRLDGLTDEDTSGSRSRAAGAFAVPPTAATGSTSSSRSRHPRL
jgi:hypothetical protein